MPDDLAETFVESRHALDDIPVGGTDFGTATYSIVGWAGAQPGAPLTGSASDVWSPATGTGISF